MINSKEKDTDMFYSLIIEGKLEKLDAIFHLLN